MGKRRRKHLKKVFVKKNNKSLELSRVPHMQNSLRQSTLTDS